MAPYAAAKCGGGPARAALVGRTHDASRARSGESLGLQITRGLRLGPPEGGPRPKPAQRMCLRSMDVPESKKAGSKKEKEGRLRRP